jgi:hypothetical protein
MEIGSKMAVNILQNRQSSHNMLVLITDLALLLILNGLPSRKSKSKKRSGLLLQFNQQINE